MRTGGEHVYYLIPSSELNHKPDVAKWIFFDLLRYVIVEEKVDEVGILVVSGPLQGRVARDVPQVGAGPVLQEKLDDLNVPVFGRHHDGLDVPQGGVGSFLHQQFGHLSVAVPGGLAERTGGPVVLLLGKGDLGGEIVHVCIVPGQIVALV